MAFREKEGSGGNTFKWDSPGTVLEGRLIGFKKGKTFSNNPRPSDLVIIQQKDGVQVIAGAPSVLYGKLTDPPAVPIGSIVRITYLGEQQGKTAKYKGFKVEVDEAPVAVDIAAKVANLIAPQPIQGGVGDYDALAARLRAHNPAGADAQLAMLTQLYPDAATRTEQLKVALKQQGVAV